jgi:hypothetical protein
MVLGWVEEARPHVSIVTDGSGRSGASRIASSERVLRAANAEVGTVWGAISDPSFYQAVLEYDVDLFVNLAVRLGRELAETRPPYVAGDAREGFNPMHDICRMMIDAAVRLARRGGVTMGNYAFFLFASHEKAPRQGTMRKALTDAELERKIAAARGYAELSAEVEAMFSGTARNLFSPHPDLAAMMDASREGMNERALAMECLVPAESLPQSNDERPFYELYGERLAAAGTYARAIRYREHVQPIERALAAL